MSVLSIIEELREIKGKGSVEKKKAILTENYENQDLKDFFYYSLDPQINYWQEKIKPAKLINMFENPLPLFGNDGIMKLIIDKLVSREITGNAAIALLGEFYTQLDEEDQQLLEMIIKRKPDVGMGAKTINDIWDHLIYDCAYMRCKGYNPKAIEKWDWSWVISQIKADGMFLNIIDGNNEFTIRSRSGEMNQNLISVCPEEIEAFKYIADNINIPEPVFHGEAVVWCDGKPLNRSKSNGLINSIRTGESLPDGHYIKFSLWDVIPKINFDEHLKYPVQYKKRFQELENAIKKSHADGKSSNVELIEYKIVKNPAEIAEHFVSVLQRGLEGTVVKCADGVWAYHDSPSQLKVKNVFEIEMKVTGFKEGNGKYASTFGSMEIESEDGKVISSISGINDKLRNVIHENRDHYIDKVVTVKVNGVFQNDDGTYGLMHPRYSDIREDRLEADSLERILQQEQDAIYGTKLAKNMK